MVFSFIFISTSPCLATSKELAVQWLTFVLSTAAARARKCVRQEMAIGPTADSAPEFSTIEWSGRQTDQRQMKFMIIASGVDNCNRAAVLDTMRIGMKPLVQQR